MSESYGPSLQFSESVHQEKYRGKGESFKEAMNRVANALKDNKEHYHEFRETLLNMQFMPAGRVQTAMGSTKNVTPYNCFVSGTIEDSFVHGNGSIMDIAKQAAATMRMGGGIGYDFSTLRPSGDVIKKLGSHSSGPISFMSIYNAVCQCTASSGHRRGAQMGVLRVDHPDIEDYIHAKQPPKEAGPVMDMLAKCNPGTTEWAEWYATLQSVLQLTGFNISIAITDEFMRCVADDKPFALRFGNQRYREVDAVALWDTIMRSTWDWAEPGVLFIDKINRMNNLYYCEEIVATNPCGEQPLPPHGACLLGSFNLVKYLKKTDGVYEFDWDLFMHHIPHVVRAMDNIVDRATYPLYEQEKEAKSKRRMGIGVTGLANAFEAMLLPYGSPEFVAMEQKVLSVLNRECYRASALLAQEKGAFPLYHAKKYLNGEFIKTLDDETRDMIKKHGIRNSHLTSIAPTGTISMCADNISSGIEPVFAYKQKRIVNMPGGTVETDFDDYGYSVLGVSGKRCEHVTVDEHLDVMACAAANVDSAVSKTCNVPPDMDWDEFKGLYTRAWQRGCKGITTFQTGGKRAGILKSADEPEQEPEKTSACRIDLKTGRKECD